MTDSDGPGPGDAQPKGEPEDRPELDIDTVFAAIVADFSAPSPPGGGPWPASEDLADETDEPSSSAEGNRADGRDGADGWDGTDATSTPDGRDGGRPSQARPEPGSEPDPEGDRGPGGPAGAPDRRDAVRRRIVLPGEDQRPGDADPPRPAGRDDQDDDAEDGYVPPEPPPLPRGDLVARLAWGSVIGGPLFLLGAALTWRTLPSMLLLLALLAFVGGFVTLVARMPQDHPDDPDDGAVV